MMRTVLPSLPGTSISSLVNCFTAARYSGSDFIRLLCRFKHNPAPFATPAGLESLPRLSRPARQDGGE